MAFSTYLFLTSTVYGSGNAAKRQKEHLQSFFFLYLGTHVELKVLRRARIIYENVDHASSNIQQASPLIVRTPVFKMCTFAIP